MSEIKPHTLRIYEEKDLREKQGNRQTNEQTRPYFYKSLQNVRLLFEKTLVQLQVRLSEVTTNAHV